MKKQLPTEIQNELAGSSVFFQKSTSDAPHEEPPTKSQSGEQTSTPATVIPRHHATTKSNEGERGPERHPMIKQPIEDDDKAAATLETIRKAVRQLGKEAATHRFTPHEKNVLADIVYTYTRQGYRTSENEITRIAVNWLLLDYHERGEQSVLAQMLELLHK